MELRAFAICQTCAELYPAARQCPSCDGDEVAAWEIRMSMRGHPVDLTNLTELSPPAEPVPAWKPVAAALSIGLALFAILAVAMQA